MSASRCIAFVTPSLSAGGMEKIASVCANHLAKHDDLKVFLITLTNQPSFYSIAPNVKLIQPSFDPTKLGFFSGVFKSIRYLRKTFRQFKIESCLAFGDRYNSLIVLSALGLKTKVYVSNRQNPHLSNGRLIDCLNRMLYPCASGIVAQTELAKEVFLSHYRNRNIAVIPNPVQEVESSADERLHWIVNVGRFSDQKNQFELVRIFDTVGADNWSLYLVGDGPKRHLTEVEIAKSSRKDRITITGYTADVLSYYRRGSIFAFTSRSEGFPNALAEAMAAGMAVISYDCVAGPSELIDDGVNGFLIPEGNETLYRQKLELLMSNPDLRQRMGAAARVKVSALSEPKIVQRFLEFMLPQHSLSLKGIRCES